MAHSPVDITVLKRSTALTGLYLLKIAHETSLGPWDIVSLLILDQRGPLRPSELADMTEFNTGQVTKIADRLETLGFIRRQKHPTDRRAIMLAIRPSGRRTVAQWMAPLAAPWSATAAHVGTAPLRTALDTFAQVVETHWHDWFPERSE